MVKRSSGELRTALVLALVLTACGGSGTAGSGTSATSSAGGNATAVLIPTPDQQHTLVALNQYRAQNGAGPLVLDAAITTFAIAGDQQLSAGGAWHAHFEAAGNEIFTSGFCGGAAENQGMWQGSDETSLVDQILQGMMAEGPGGGHHDNIINPAYTRLGVGLAMVNGDLWLTNDFSGSCN